MPQSNAEVFFSIQSVSSLNNSPIQTAPDSLKNFFYKDSL